MLEDSQVVNQVVYLYVHCFGAYAAAWQSDMTELAPVLGLVSHSFSMWCLEDLALQASWRHSAFSTSSSPLDQCRFRFGA